MSSTCNTTTFRAPDIHCGGCANAIERALNAREGVESVTVDIERKTVTVGYAEERVTSAELRGVLDRAGFPASDGGGPEAMPAVTPGCHAS